MNGKPTARRPIALITGATAGIGAEFARQLAADGHDLVLVARNEARLDQRAAELRLEFGVRVEVLVADLGQADALARVEARAAVAEPADDSAGPITLLVNNAGFGLRRPFDESDVDDEQRLLDVLVTAPMRLSHAALAQMLPHGAGTIVNIASVAGYAPRGSYGAAKAWLLSFSRWANIAYRSRGVSVTAVAPGLVHTEFHERMRVSGASVPRFLWLDAEQVVRLALADVRRGRAVSIPTLRYKLVVALARLLPKRLAAKGELREL
ncbi:SDR family NAD(P)-dependent oxidoreductase [Lacisediminihabitans sp.]|jgi:short-subunit dehydrogenase|uniref:SDR family NAD(P)-dependent oxidoreductase n=1 Tax=Lacisediminihabitans sp. TaxID=2787631 RepID=UPI002F9420C2